jgi:hypothetical protein
MVLCYRRSHRRGAIFDSLGFANSIRPFLAHRVDTPPKLLLSTITQAFLVHRGQPRQNSLNLYDIMVYPRIVSTDLDMLWLLAAFGETAWFGGLVPFSGSQEGRKNRVIPVGEFLTFHRI